MRVQKHYSNYAVRVCACDLATYNVWSNFIDFPIAWRQNLINNFKKTFSCIYNMNLYLTEILFGYLGSNEENIWDEITSQPHIITSQNSELS